tara:strand:+ start:362 stop:793 length:432 start_codon:yes stop_codon:yes gene_type:complete
MNPFMAGQNPGDIYAQTGLGGGTAGNSSSYRDAVAARDQTNSAQERMEAIRLAKEEREGPIEGGGTAAGYGFLENNGTVLNSGTNINNQANAIPDPNAINTSTNPGLYSGNQIPQDLFGGVNPEMSNPQRLEDSILNPLIQNS